MKFIKLIFVVLLAASPSFCQLIDKDATRETLKLFKSLKKIQKKGVVFGHQHATEYGRGWRGDDNRSDVKSVVGTHPGVIGIDFSGFTGRNADLYKKNLKKIVEDAYNRGGIITVAWHFYNPMGKGGFYWEGSDSIKVVPRLIPGGDGHVKYKEILDEVAKWVNSCRGVNGELIPMIFRPYHEFDGGWFWWGAPHCSVDEFKTLWKFTLSYLRDEKNVHSFIWAFSPDNKFNTEAEFLERYPGDEWVDMVGMDNYADMGRNRYDLDAAVAKLKVVSDYARKHKKLAAFTETGLESIPNKTWWTETLLKVLKAENLRLSYVLVWRNDQNSETHYYGPVPNHISAPDFIKFYQDKFTWFEEDLIKKNIYKKK
ncbi:glycoside hydrolase family 26 protein [Arcticibacterium luteifluviistationis]|uniref:Mannan endo-1,4-beta-mannosidase n=1 Tax=Arcticibacterium luteifluviistationis TaxID=1784714 RepID=A0A2Z4GIP4_9BACT|nr:glycosyl hydrolase [Arcticibacterium luteifluviistationis]AWW00949.1 beta-mannosidase [Arcticibacterium luteifluviistationis]